MAPLFMKKIKKQGAHISKKINPGKRNKKFKGAVDAGTVYGVLLLAIVLGAAYLMLGNIDPSIDSPDQDQQVFIKQPTDNSTHSNLQLKTFEAVTLTPSPSPTPSPTPTPTTPPPAAPAAGQGDDQGPLPLPGPGGQGGGSGGGPPGNAN
jgi:hypothetical protein